jgi:iron complex outermembrane receptor protein
MKHSRHLSFAIATLLACFAAQAAEKRDSLETVEVFGRRIEGLGLEHEAPTASRLGLSALDTPASIDVISGEVVRERGDRNIIEAVTRATGMVNEGTPGDGGAALSSRGFAGHGSVLQLYDGTRLFVGAGTITFPFDTWTVDRVEVLHGPASVMFGQGAIGGVVNVVPRRPNEDASEAQAELGFGEDSRAHAAVDLTGPITENLAYRLDASGNRSDGWVARGDSESIAVAGTLEWNVSDAVSLSLSQDYADQNPMQYWGTPLIDGRIAERLQGQNYNVRDARINYRDLWTRAKLEWQIAEDVVFTNQAEYLKADREWKDVEEYSWNADTNQIDRFSYLNILHHQNQVGDQADLRITKDVGGHDNSFVVGLDANRIHFTHVNNSPYSGEGPPVAQVGFDPGVFINPDGTTPKFRTETDQYAFFLEDRFALNDQWSVIGGMRYDSATVERRNLVNGVVFEKTLDSTAWRGGVVYQPVETLSFYGSYTTSADPLGSLITLSAAAVPFDLTTGEQLEVGVKQSLWDKRVEWTLAAYRIEKHDLITQDPRSADPEALRQVGEQSSKGIEASVAIKLPARWRVDANLALLHAQYDRFFSDDVSFDGNTPNSVPEQTANVWLSWSPTDQWQGRIGLRHVGKQFVDDEESIVMDEYNVLDAGLDWAPTPSLSLTATVHNLTDKVYAVSAYTFAQRILGQPRTAELTARYRF